MISKRFFTFSIQTKFTINVSHLVENLKAYLIILHIFADVCYYGIGADEKL